MGLKSKLFPPQKRKFLLKNLATPSCAQCSKIFFRKFLGDTWWCLGRIPPLCSGNTPAGAEGKVGSGWYRRCSNPDWLPAWQGVYNCCTIAPAPKGSLLVVLGSHSPCMVWNWHGAPARYNAFWYRTTSKSSHTWYFWIQCRLESDV